MQDNAAELLKEKLIDPEVARQKALQRLRYLAERLQNPTIKELFIRDPERAAKFSVQAEALFFDYSKTPINDEIRQALFDLAEAAGIEQFRQNLFKGQPVNKTENRAALHTALRSDYGISQEDPAAEACRFALQERKKMRAFTEAVQQGLITSSSGKKFTHVVNIGIGGSDLGPHLVCRALTADPTTRFPSGLKACFLADPDPVAVEALFQTVPPEQTLFLIVSKTFKTAETLSNAKIMKEYLQKALNRSDVSAHFVGITADEPAALAFGIRPDRIFLFKDWVGGRFSLWSPVGLSIALSAGFAAFEELLAGAALIDRHVLTAPLEKNLPLLAALTDLWLINGQNCRASAVLPYDTRLSLLPAYLQQLEMESNGKSCLLNGDKSLFHTAPVIFGTVGIEAQHSFMQAVHQGTSLIPVTFILPASTDKYKTPAGRLPAANALAQAQALLQGLSAEEISREMRQKGFSEAEIRALVRHRVFEGNRPSIFLLCRPVNASVLGQLLAFFEHKIAFSGALWGINSFDQWGVELGKKLAENILPLLEEKPEKTVREIPDPSTRQLIAVLKKFSERHL